MAPEPNLTNDVEGLDVETSNGWGDYPLDAVFVRTEPRTVGEVVKRIKRNRYILDPDFQRDFVWPAAKQSKLIESCVMRIPLPVFYVAEATDGRIVVVDGLQRLTTFTRFLSDQLELVELSTRREKRQRHPLEGKRFSDLPVNLQERVLDTQLTMYILDAKAPERARLDIFERVNSGEPLTRQQMRNALYSGPATKWLRSAAESSLFKSSTGRSLDVKKMRDREAINRFCAFKLLGWESYTTGDMDSFLAESLTKLNKANDRRRDKLREDFDRSMKLNAKLFGEHAFRKSLASATPGVGRSVLNISLFEVCAVSLAAIEAPLDSGRRRHLHDAIVDLFRQDEAFVRAITYSTNSTAAVSRRFAAMENVVNQAMT